MQATPNPLQQMRLCALVPTGRFADPDANADVWVRACSCDSRTIRPGDVFVAVPGRSQDGHEFVAQAAQRGASAVVVERPVAACGVPQYVVPSSSAAFGLLCQAFAGNPATEMKVIGVTGTNGKTTTCMLIARILKVAGYNTALSSTLGTFDGDEYASSDWTTPPADHLAQWFRRSLDNGCSHAVVEVSSHGLDQSRTAGIPFDAACVTNVRRDHLDYHGTIEAYRHAKGRLFEALRPGGIAVLNADDSASADYLPRLSGPVLTVGMQRTAEITGTLIEQFVSEQTFLLTAGSDTIPVRTRMIGSHHVYNCMTAAAVGLAFDLDLPTIVRAIESIEYVPGRLERIERGQPFGVFVDFAHTPDALTIGLQALREVARGKLICVFGAGGERDRGKRPLMGRAVEAAADIAVVTTDNPRSENPLAIIGEILGGLRGTGESITIPDREEAIYWALSKANPGDVVLIAGRGHESHQIIGGEQIPFDDREVAGRWLSDLEPALW